MQYNLKLEQVGFHRFKSIWTNTERGLESRYRLWSTYNGLDVIYKNAYSKQIEEKANIMERR